MPTKIKLDASDLWADVGPIPADFKGSRSAIFTDPLDARVTDLEHRIATTWDALGDLESDFATKADLCEVRDMQFTIEELRSKLEGIESKMDEKKEKRISMICLPITKKEYNALGAAVAYLKENDTLKGICADLEDMYNRIDI